MFRKIVANLPFSPALIGQLSFYARRLKKEETTRRAGLIVTALALVVQSLAVFSPPEAVNASSTADFVPGGVTSMRDLLHHYDKNTGKLRSTLSSLGITRGEVAKLSKKTIGERGNYNWSRTSLYSHAQGQRSWNYGGGTVYYRPMTLTAGAKTTHAVYAGMSKEFGWFAIKIDCGNLITSKPPQKPKPQLFCSNLTTKRLSRTGFYFKAAASSKNGAKIKRFQFVVSTTPGNKVLKRINISTNKSSAATTFVQSSPGTYKVRVWISGAAGTITSQNCVQRITVLPPPSKPSISVTKNIDGVKEKTVSIDKKFTYNIVVKNTGNTILKNVSVEDKQPEGVKFLSASTGSIQNKAWKHTIASLAPGKSASFKVTAVVTAYTPHSLVNTVCVDAPSVPGKPDDCDNATVDVPPPPTPSAACEAVSVAILNKNIVSLTGNAVTHNGASIKKYIYTVTDSKQNVVKRIDHQSDKALSTPESFTLSPGSYTVTLGVVTSIGTKTNESDCVKKFKIEEPTVCAYNPAYPENSPECQPCPTQPDIWIKDERCSSDIINTKKVTNMSRGGINATTTVAHAGDKLSYTITTENTGLLKEELTMTEQLKDVLEYSTLIDNGGGSFDKDKQTLSWAGVTVEPGEKQHRTFVVQLLNEIPLTNTGTSDQDSYDCKLVNTFGNSTEVRVDCKPEKVIVEQIVTELPTTGPRENMMFASVLLAVVVYFYARSRQLGKEVRLVRKNAHAGTI